jgi:hypothetical protein
VTTTAPPRRRTPPETPDSRRHREWRRRRHRQRRPTRELIEAITTFIDDWNERCQPFAWTKDADTIIAKAHRKSTSDTRH